MAQQLLTESSKKPTRWIAHHVSPPAHTQSVQGVSHSPLLQLQRTMGNQRVAQLIQAKRLTPQGKVLNLQPKLTVGSADGHLEQEADRVARQVVSTPDAVATNSIQRAIAPEEDKDQKIQTKPLAASITPVVQRQMGNDNKEDKDKPIQPKSAASQADSFEAGAEVESRLSQSKGGGSPLPEPVRAYMEPRFGVDFSPVRVHTDSDAIQMNRDIGAQAFTHGSDVYYDAESNPSNLELTAHELTHVVQQTGGGTLIQGAPAGSAVQRKPRREAKSDTEHVGGEPGSMTFLEGPGGTTLAPGEAGYARRMLTETGTVAEKFEGYQQARLLNVAPSFTVIDKQIKKRGDEVAYFNDKKDEFGNLPSTVRTWTRARDWCQNHGQELESNRASEEEKMAAYNAWVPRANGFFTSLTRLDAMQDMLGVKDPKAMAAALTKGLSEAQAIGQRMQLAHDKGQGETPDIPAVDESLAEVSAAATQAALEMNTAYLGFQQILLADRGAAVDEEGEQDRNRLQQINEVKSFVRNVGKTVDVTMSVVQGAPAAISSATTTVARAGATANAVRNRRLINAGKAPRHNPTYITVDDKGNMIVRNVQTGMDRPIEGGEQTTSPEGEGFKLPTSVSDLLGTIADFAYSGEIREINMRLESIKARCDMISGASKLINIRKKTQNLQDKLNAFALKCNELQKRIQQRRQAYLEFGVQLDNFARRDQESRKAGLAPGQGEERYATILTVVSSVREVLSLGEGAVGGFASAREIESWAQSLNAARTKSPPRTDIEYFRLPDSEWMPLEKMWSNVKTFGDNVGMLRMMFAGVETQARALIGGLHQGSGGAGGAY